MEHMRMQLIQGPLLFLLLCEKKAAAWVRGYTRCILASKLHHINDHYIHSRHANI